MSVATQTQTQTLLDALRALASRCDGARENDGQGFNKFDSNFGKSLASQNTLTEKQETAARKMLVRYRSQLASLGFNLSDLQSTRQQKPYSVPQTAYNAPTIDNAPNTASDTTPVQKTQHMPTRGARISGNSIIFSFPYDTEIKDDLKNTFPRMALFDGTSKTWKVPASKILDAIAWSEKWHFDHSDLDSALLAKQQSLAAEQTIADREYQARIAKINLDNVGNGLILREYQKTGIQALVRKEKCILADDMGLGKTLQALMAAKCYADTHSIFVIAPISLHDNWRREAQRLNCPIEIFSWAKIPSAPTTRRYIIIADEAHYAQNLKSQRTQKLLDLCVRASAIYLLSGTPIKNGRPANLYPLLVAVGHRLSKNKKQYELRYCDAKPTRWCPWDVSGATHLNELQTEISDILIRRTKSEVLKDLPEKTRILQSVELTPEDARLYDQTVATLQAEYRERKEHGKIKDGGEALVLLNHMRHAGSIAKCNAACCIAEEVLEQGQSVVMFFEFSGPAQKAAEKLASYGVSLLTGDTPQKDRDTLVQKFQAGEHRVFIGTIKAGGVGITLTASSTVLCVDRPWTPGDICQAEDRIHRIGQNNACTAYWLQWGECDASIDNLLVSKAEKIGVVLADESVHIDYLDLADSLLG